MKNIEYSCNGFTTSRLKRFLKTGGRSYTFIQPRLNNYNEPTEEIASEITILGVIHRGNANVSNANISNAAKTRSVSTTAIITSWGNLIDNFSGASALSTDMTIIIDNFKYKIIKIENLNNWGIVAEIYLEVYDGWEH